MSDLDDEELEATRILNGSKNKYDKTFEYLKTIEFYRSKFTLENEILPGQDVNIKTKISNDFITNSKILEFLYDNLIHGNLKIVDKELIEENKKLKEIKKRLEELL